MAQIVGRSYLPGPTLARPGRWEAMVDASVSTGVPGFGTSGTQDIVSGLTTARDNGAGANMTLANGWYLFRYVPDTHGSAPNDGPTPWMRYQVTGNTTWKAVVDAQPVGPPPPPDLAAQVAADRAAAEAARDAAQAVPATTDGLVASQVSNAGSSTTAALKQRYVTEGAAFSDIAKYAGVDPTGAVECSAAIQAALDDIKAKGKRAYACGVFKVNNVLINSIKITSNATLGDAIWNFGGSGTAVALGNLTSGAQLQKIDVVLPKIIAVNKNTTGWSQVAGTVGVDVVNLNASHVTVPEVTNFEVNMRVRGFGTGNAYNTFAMGNLHNGKTNLLLTADATGWSNQNKYDGGRYSHESSEGQNAPGTRHIAMDVTANAINNNTWIGASVEFGVAEWTLIGAGSYNVWKNCRWEVEPGGARVRWESNSHSNTIENGYGADRINETYVAGASRNRIVSATFDRWEVSGPAVGGSGRPGGMVLENFSSAANPFLWGMAAGARTTGVSVTTGYLLAISAQAIRMKRTGDAFDRIQIDGTNGQVLVGDGTDTPRAGGTTAQRPNPVLGRTYFDTSLGRPIFGSGSNWRDATGTAV